MRRLLVVSLLASSPALAEDGKTRFIDRFLYGVEASANFGEHDNGYFNETDYQRNNLRLFRLTFQLEFLASEQFSVLTEIRTDNLDRPLPYALYVRLRPWVERAFDVQVGRIPAVFGAFSRRRYDLDNPLIGYPLAYQYPTIVRTDAAPGGIDELAAIGGRGAKVRYPLGVTAPHAGLPVLNPLRWDTGVQVRIGEQPLQLAVALTQGTVSRPQVRDDNPGKQLAGRFGFRPVPAFDVGASFARGEYMTSELQELLRSLGYSPAGQQTAWGFDFDFSRNHLGKGWGSGGTRVAVLRQKSNYRVSSLASART